MLHLLHKHLQARHLRVDLVLLRVLYPVGRFLHLGRDDDHVRRAARQDVLEGPVVRDDGWVAAPLANAMEEQEHGVGAAWVVMLRKAQQVGVLRLPRHRPEPA